EHRSNMIGGAAWTEGHSGRSQKSGPGFFGRLRISLLGSRALYQAPHCFRWLRTALYPVVDSLAIELDIERLPMRIVLAEYFYKPPVTFGALLGYDDPIKGLLLRAHSRQSDGKQTTPPFFAAGDSTGVPRDLLPLII